MIRGRSSQRPPAQGPKVELKQDISLCSCHRQGTVWGARLCLCPEGLGAARAAASGSDSGAGTSSELTPLNVPLRRLVLELEPPGGAPSQGPSYLRSILSRPQQSGSARAGVSLFLFPKSVAPDSFLPGVRHAGLLPGTPGGSPSFHCPHRGPPFNRSQNHLFRAPIRASPPG